MILLTMGHGQIYISNGPYTFCHANVHVHEKPVGNR